MATADAHRRPALSYAVIAGEGGKIEFQGPFPPGQRLTVVVVPDAEPECADLVAAAGSSLDFWDNRLDDEDWNAPETG
jgi:hypothetical protein